MASAALPLSADQPRQLHHLRIRVDPPAALHAGRTYSFVLEASGVGVFVNIAIVKAVDDHPDGEAWWFTRRNRDFKHRDTHHFWYRAGGDTVFSLTF